MDVVRDARRVSPRYRAQVWGTTVGPANDNPSDSGDEMKDKKKQNRNDVAEFAYWFPHERLDCYQLAVEVFRWIQDKASEGDQLYRACESIVLNIAEGCSHSGKTRRYHYRKALGSAAEACGKLDIVKGDVAAQQQKLRRIGMMLRVMIC